jgi:hypothetical protein
MEQKLNGFNNGRDTTDGVGGRPGPFERMEGSIKTQTKIIGNTNPPPAPPPMVEQSYKSQREINKSKNMKTVTLKSSAIVKIDDLNNIWYVSDIDSVLGRMDVNGRFNPIQGREFTSEMLAAISTLMKDAQAQA